MDTLDITALEHKIDRLLLFCGQLQAENQTLKDKCARLASERDMLLDKNEHALHRIEHMIARLKALEPQNEQQ
ncbi:TIGR02449 family protein [Allopseudospirillum japonicum]|uniref:TIGR02449 family protein n=1 Tax=Allopseudospirillum japonicum TaxID=64971 RepID=UPI000B88A75D|nr:TIGR02449 family protein [Allopseudospirillum japonicum]